MSCLKVADSAIKALAKAKNENSKNQICWKKRERNHESVVIGKKKKKKNQGYSNIFRKTWLQDCFPNFNVSTGYSDFWADSRESGKPKGGCTAVLVG